MPIINRIAEFHAEMTQWRHQIHAHRETAFEEHKTAELVAGLLEAPLCRAMHKRAARAARNLLFCALR